MITDGRKNNEMFIFPIDLWKFYLGISKPIKDAKTTDDFKNKLKGWIWENIH